METQEEKAIAAAARALDEAMMCVANMAENYESELREFAQTVGQARPDPETIENARVAASDLVSTLDAWKRASNAFHEAQMRRRRA